MFDEENMKPERLTQSPENTGIDPSTMSVIVVRNQSAKMMLGRTKSSVNLKWKMKTMCGLVQKTMVSFIGFIVSLLRWSMTKRILMKKIDTASISGTCQFAIFNATWERKITTEHVERSSISVVVKLMVLRTTISTYVTTPVQKRDVEVKNTSAMIDDSHG